jgi:hypothetical protein
MNARLAKPIQHDLVYSLGLSVSTNASRNTFFTGISGATIGRAAGQ